LYKKTLQDAKNNTDVDDNSVDEFSQKHGSAIEAAAASSSGLRGTRSSGKFAARGSLNFPDPTF
jgi:hypothetical protein